MECSTALNLVQKESFPKQGTEFFYGGKPISFRHSLFGAHQQNVFYYGIGTSMTGY